MEKLPATIKTPASIGASLFLDVDRFEHAQRVAKMLATSTMIPEHFRNNIGNCVIALNLAERFMADPFMVMQNVYVVHGRPGLEGKLVIALINQSGKFTPLQFKIDRNNGMAVACTAYATHKETKEVLEQTVTWKMVQAEGWDQKKSSKWLTMPELMFQYRSATFFARVYCPEVILGMQTVDEIFDFVEMKKVSNGSYQAPEPEPLDTSEFDILVNKYPDSKLEKFLELTAQAQSIPVDQLKVSAAEDFDGFWKAFEAWRLKTYPAEDAKDFKCPHCDFKAQSERGLKKHITQQHPFKTEKAKDHFNGKTPETSSETLETQTEAEKEESAGKDDFNEEAEKAAKIKAIRQSYPDYLIQAQESLSLVTYQLEELNLDTLELVLDKCKELANDKPF